MLSSEWAEKELNRQVYLSHKSIGIPSLHKRVKSCTVDSAVVIKGLNHGRLDSAVVIKGLNHGREDSAVVEVKQTS